MCGLNRVALHADLTILAKLAWALSRARAVGAGGVAAFRSCAILAGGMSRDTIDAQPPDRTPSPVVRLPTALVARYRAVDRELVPAPLWVCDTPKHLEALTESIGLRGIYVPLRLGFNRSFGFLDGNHRIAVALRLGLPDVPVELVREHPATRRDHGQPMRPADLAVLIDAFSRADAVSFARPS